MVTKYLSIGILGLALMAGGCATAHVDCPDDGSITTIAVGGSTVGLQLLTAGLQAAKTAGFMATRGASSAPAPATSHVDYSWVPIFGSDYVACSGHMQPASAPTPTVIVVPSNTVSQPTILK